MTTPTPKEKRDRMARGEDGTIDIYGTPALFDAEPTELLGMIHDNQYDMDGRLLAMMELLRRQNRRVGELEKKVHSLQRTVSELKKAPGVSTWTPRKVKQVPVPHKVAGKTAGKNAGVKRTPRRKPAPPRPKAAASTIGVRE